MGPCRWSTLVQVMAWCRQATNHCLNQCWPRSTIGVTRPHWVKSEFSRHNNVCSHIDSLSVLTLAVKTKKLNTSPYNNRMTIFWTASFLAARSTGGQDRWSGGHNDCSLCQWAWNTTIIGSGSFYYTYKKTDIFVEHHDSGTRWKWRSFYIFS